METKQLSHAEVEQHYAYHRKDKDRFTRLNLKGKLNKAKARWQTDPRYKGICHYECEVLRIYDAETA